MSLHMFTGEDLKKKILFKFNFFTEFILFLCIFTRLSLDWDALTVGVLQSGRTTYTQTVPGEAADEEEF